VKTLTFVEEIDTPPKGHLMVRRAYDAFGYWTAPWWAAIVLRPAHLARIAFLGTFYRKTHFETMLMRAKLDGLRLGRGYPTDPKP